jgi:hypothetical protein
MGYYNLTELCCDQAVKRCFTGALYLVSHSIMMF